MMVWAMTMTTTTSNDTDMIKKTIDREHKYCKLYRTSNLSLDRIGT